MPNTTIEVTMYDVSIDAVSGDRYHTCMTPDRAEALASLEKYDHEGSSVTLRTMQVTTTRKATGEIQHRDLGAERLIENPELAYQILKGEA